ncbi:MAG: single-stranded DNA-binding protein [Rubritepida sp.]|nr:single-stranded DNA-binding protein [Rubritepida sp.]
MAGVNKVIILGRLGKDPEVRNFQNGGKVVNLRLATSERFKDREGVQQERTEWHSVAIFNEKLGEIAERYLKKGSEVYIEGQLETRKWQDQAGAEKYTTEIVLRQYRGELSLIGGRASGGSDAGEERSYGGGGGERSSAPARAAPAARTGAWDSGKKADMDDDIPF